MENFEKMSIQEMDTTEMKEIYGGAYSWEHGADAS